MTSYNQQVIGNSLMLWQVKQTRRHVQTWEWMNGRMITKEQAIIQDVISLGKKIMHTVVLRKWDDQCAPEIITSREKEADAPSYLEISVDNVVLMQVSQSRYDLSSVESCPIFREDAVFGQMVEQLSTVHILHDEAQSIRCLEWILQMLEWHGKNIRTRLKGWGEGGRKSPFRQYRTHCEEGMLGFLEHTAFC